MTSAFGVEHEISKYSKAYGTNRYANKELNEKGGFGQSPKLQAVKILSGKKPKKRKKKVLS